MLKRIAVAVLIVSLFLAGCGNCRAKYITLKINGVLFKLEVADTQAKREAGLSGRTLKQNEGMLFVFENSARYPFWMKGCLEPLDIIWIDEEKTVVGILEELPVYCGDDYEIYRPSSKISYAIELKGGTSHKIGLEIGDGLEI